MNVALLTVNAGPGGVVTGVWQLAGDSIVCNVLVPRAFRISGTV